MDCMKLQNRTVCRQEVVSLLTTVVGASLQMARGLLNMGHCPLGYSMLIVHQQDLIGVNSLYVHGICELQHDTFSSCNVNAKYVRMSVSHTDLEGRSNFLHYNKLLLWSTLSTFGNLFWSLDQ